MAYRLDIAIQGESDGKRSMTLADDKPAIIGRKQPADIVISLPEVSGRHAEINFNANTGVFAIQDLGSKLGT
ncbi:MAG: FHA domain-containing protein, partial [Candidatus Sumerlaeota bacterium]